MLILLYLNLLRRTKLYSYATVLHSWVIKEKIKTYLENHLYNLLKDTADITEARTIINDNIPTIKDNIETIFNDEKYAKTYNLNFGYNYFPNKVYKGTTYKEGYYESLVISIGEAKGDNWWCVLFPNFCLIDTVNTQKHKSLIKETIKKYSKK